MSVMLPDSPFERTSVISKDGTPLVAFATRGEQSPPLVLVNAFGMPGSIFAPLASRLERDYRVITWQSRGVPDTTVPFDRARCSMRDHVDDLRAVMDAFQVRQTKLLGWCSGAQVALRFASTDSDRVEKLVLLTGSYRLPDDFPRSPWIERLLTFIPTCASSPQRARFYSTFFVNQAKQTKLAGEQVSEGCGQALLRSMTEAPFMSAEALYRYSNLQLRFWDEPTHAWAPGVTTPTLVIGAEDDAITLPECSSEIARRLSSAELLLVPGDHDVHYVDPGIAESVRRFLRGKAARSSASQTGVDSAPLAASE